MKFAAVRENSKRGTPTMEVLQELLAGNSETGRVEWIGVSGSNRADIQFRESVRIVAGGIEGDHHCRPSSSSSRQVTLIQGEHLPVVAAILQRSAIDPGLLRRNLVVTGINLAALKHQVFQIGSALLRGSGDCPPCSRMEENLGTGGYAAMLNHGGITAVVESEGVVCLGDAVRAVPFP